MNQVQQKQFELLSCFVRLCEKLDIPYYLVCGSALGAVKYGGFIPWDDDVDVGLLRSDYERFLREAPAHLPEGLFLQTFRSDPAYPNLFAKLRDDRTTFVEQAVAHLPMHHGIFLDIFPLDGYPEEPREQKRLERRKRRYQRWLLAAFDGRYSRYKLKTRLAVGLMRALGMHKRTAKILERYEKTVSVYDPNVSSVICNHGNWQGRREYAPRHWYGAGRAAVFEGLSVRIPSKAESYLIQKYGDYKADPPPCEQIGHHVCIAVDTEAPYTVTEGGRSRRLVCLAHYDLPDHADEERRVCHPAALSKCTYLFDCFVRLGYPLYILSASQTRGERTVGGSLRRLDEKKLLEMLPAWGRRGRVHNGIGRVLFSVRLFFRLMTLVGKGDTVWVYHSLGLMSVVRWLKCFKRFRLILEFEELYGDVRGIGSVSRRELGFARLADAYIFPTEALHERVNTKGKPYAVAHGAYTLPSVSGASEPERDGIHVVYAGTLDPHKGGVYAAMDAAAHLPKGYHVHILGTGTPQQVRDMRTYLEQVKLACACELTYDGVLHGDAYSRFLQGCHIGLSTQDPRGAFNATSFPSKILPYMANGLRVVSARIPVVEQSRVGGEPVYYDEPTPTAIARAIRSVGPHDERRGPAVIAELDRAFLTDLKRLMDADTE